jgi:hypothetical protein
MRIHQIQVLDQDLNNDEKSGLIVQSKNPVLATVMAERRGLIQHPLDRNAILIERITSQSRVDAFQTHLTTMLKGRDVYDYSEGEVLDSWKQMQIEGIFELRIRFMKHFANYIKHIVNQDKNAVFLLNRFHLSAYVFTIIQQPKLEPEYEEIIAILRTLPVHVFMLQLEKNEIEERSWHPERSGAWRKFQQQIVERDGFQGRLERYAFQQRVMLEKAETQKIPYSVIKISYEPEIGEGLNPISESPSITRPRMPRNAADAKISRTR